MSILVTIIAFIAVIAGAFEGHKLQQRRIKNTLIRGVQKQQAIKQQIQRHKIQQLDKNFSESLIKSRVEHAFFTVKQAWSEHNISLAVAFISDGLAESMQMFFQIQKKQNRWSKIDNLTLLSCEIVGLEADKHFETLHFKLHSQARYPIFDGSGLKPSNNASPSPLSTLIEYWTFVRLPGTQTRNNPGLIEGICPNCGDQLILSQFALCKSCGSLVGSGEYDWILAKITSAAQWRFQNAKRQISGVADYQVVDPAFNIPLIEDRVTAIFWRLQKAWLLQKTDPLLSVSQPAFVTQFQQTQLQKHYFDNVHLGLCEVSSVEFGEPFDKVYLLLKWQANKHDLQTKQQAETGFYAHHITLVRQTGVISDIKKGLHSLHCYRCGAPQTDSYQDCCEYCGTRFNSAEQDWILSDFSPHLEHLIKIKGQQFSIDIPQKKREDRIFDPISLLSSLVLVLYADGQVDPAEKKLLTEFIKNRRIPKTVLEDILHAAKVGELEMLTPDQTLDASDWLDKLIEMCLADGQVCTAEKKLLLQFGAKFNILAIDINLRIKRIRQQLYLKNKQILKQSDSNDKQ